jgi:hypothetical protein
MFYRDYSDGLTTHFDRPVVDIVRDAFAVELKRAGFVVVGETEGRLRVSCDILGLRAIITRGVFGFGENVLELVVVVRFDWKDPSSGNLVASHEQCERRSRKVRLLSPGLPEDHGQELINDMLPRVLEKEIQDVLRDPRFAGN